METIKKATRIEVFDIQRFTDKDNLKAFADVRLGLSIRVYGFRVIQQPPQKAWVSPPQRSWQGKDGTTKYAPIIELTGDLKDAVDQAVLAAYFDGA